MKIKLRSDRRFKKDKKLGWHIQPTGFVRSDILKNSYPFIPHDWVSGVEGNTTVVLKGFAIAGFGLTKDGTKVIWLWDRIDRFIAIATQVIARVVDLDNDKIIFGQK